MNFIEEIRNTTKTAKENIYTRGNKIVIKGAEKKIRDMAKQGRYETTYYVPDDVYFYGDVVKNYFIKEGFKCHITVDFEGDYMVKISWEEE